MKLNVPWERSVRKARYRLKLQGARGGPALVRFRTVKLKVNAWSSASH
jgi:hypothetical protein